MRLEEIIDSLRAKGQFRELKTIYKTEGKYIVYKNQKLINLASNDYLGISANNDLYINFIENINKNINKLGAVSSRLISGNYDIYEILENYISNLYNKESCIVFNSGYHANTGILPAITTKKDLIIADKLVHASIINGIKLSNAKFERYKHLDYNHLETILIKKRNKYNNVFIVSESIFSMDGDKANLKKLILLKKQYDTYLYIDEAHSFGVCGNKGLGLCEVDNLCNDIDIIIGTFGKAIASIGAFSVFSNIFKNLIINKSRSFIYTTALPPLNLEWTFFILQKLEKFNTERKKLKELNLFIIDKLNQIGIKSNSNTHIIPVLIGKNEKTIKLQENLMKNGFFVSAIRPPTIPINTARIRLSLNTALDKEDFYKMLEILKPQLID